MQTIQLGEALVEVWDWLRPWWDWWAGFTDLFDWEAISAVATAAAVMVALDQATKTKRVANRRNLAVLKDLLAMVEPIAESFSWDERGYLDPISLQVLCEGNLFSRAEAGIKRHDAITIREAGVSFSVEYMLDTLRGVQSGTYESLRADDGEGPPSFGWLADLDYIFEELISSSAKAEHGRVGYAIERWMKPTKFAFGSRILSPDHFENRIG